MNLNEMSLNELKALAYDCLASIEINQKNLQIINAVIQKKIEEQKDKV